MVIFITRIPIFILAEIRGFGIRIYMCVYKVCARMENWKFNRFNLGWFWNEGGKGRDGCAMVVKMARRNMSFKCLICIID